MGDTSTLERADAPGGPGRVAGIRAAASRRPATTAFVVALAARVLVAVAVAVLFDGSLFPDDRTYVDMAAAAAAGETAHWGSYLHDLYRANAALLVPLTVLYTLFGPSQLVAMLFVALFGAATAGLTAALAHQVWDRRWALAAGLVVALFPSQILWSSLVLKDAIVWASAAALGVVVARSQGATGRRLLGYGAAVVTVMVVLYHVRDHILVVAAWALVLATLYGAHRSVVRARRALGAAAIALIVPWVLGIGPAGFGLVLDAGSLQDRRVANAQNAGTAFVGDDVVVDERSGGSDGLEADLAHLGSGLAVMVLRPYPWQDLSNVRVRAAALEHLAWYPLLALAGVGLLQLRRRPEVLLYPALYGAGSITLYALAEGNFGTAYRHRGEAVWVVALLAVAGARALARKRSPGAGA